MFKTENKKYNVVAGKVTFVNYFEKDNGSGVSLTFKTKEEEIVVIFKNTEAVNFTDRFTRAGVKSGNLIACYVGSPNEGEGNTKFYTGFEFSYAGRVFSLKNEDGTNTNVFFGYIGEKRIGKSGQVIIPGAVHSYNKETKEKTTEWINFDFWNSENGAHNADNATKYLSKGDAVAIVCSDITDFTTDKGNVYKSARAYRFSKFYKDSPKTEE